MKARWLRVVIAVVAACGLCSAVGAEEGRAVEQMSRKKALTIAERTPEARALYELYNKSFRNCLEISVVRPCETDWVTCIDDAWVVRFEVGEQCKVPHDGRLNLTIVVGTTDGRIISRYPEEPYFKTADYCVIDGDCLGFADKCLNFIHGQLSAEARTEDACYCQASRCAEKAP